MVLAYITCKDEIEAKNISIHLLKKKLIACSNIFPISSFYRWKGKIVDDKEYVIIAKTTEQKFRTLEREVEKIHSYKIPCIMKINGSANKKYQEWVYDSLS